VRKALLKNTLAVVFGTLLCLAPAGITEAAESPMPAQFQEKIQPELAAKYTYTQDGQYTKALNIPTYEWKPVGTPVKAVVLAIHGLTLHGRKFRVLARALASNGIAFVSMDMRGFGRCQGDDQNQFSTAGDDKSKVNHEKSYQDIVQLAKLVKEQYPDVRMAAMGESLGCTFCVRLAAEHPDLVYGVVLSAPAVRVNKAMYAGKGQIRQGLKAVLKRSHELDMSGFFADLCSQRQEVQQELLDDPMVLKRLKLKALASTDTFVAKTAKWGKMTRPELAVLILQGSVDGCVSPKRVTDLMNNMKSDDQTLAWRGNFGHLQLETNYMRVATLDAISNWMIAHGSDSKIKMQRFQQNIADAGGIVTK
jgi:alpha-beta hydrolase superfamily lysophospholipase